MTMTSKLMLTVVLATVASSAVPHAMASRDYRSSRVKLHASGNDTGIAALTGAGTSECYYNLRVQMGPVWIGNTPNPSITFRIFSEEGLSVASKAYSFSLFDKENMLVELEMSGECAVDPCRLILKSDNAWQVQDAWFFRWVKVTMEEEVTRTFAINKWIGPEMYGSFVEIDHCPYDAPPTAA